MILAAVVAFGIVLFFTKGRHSTPASGAPSNTVAGQPQNQGQNGQSSTGSAPTSSSSSTSESTAALPSGSTECRVSRNETSTLADNNAVLTGQMMSCDFAAQVISAVNTQVSSNPSQTTFSLDEHSDYTNGDYHFDCNRENHVTNCSGQGGNGQIGVAVQDNQ